MRAVVVDLGSLYCRALCLGWDEAVGKYRLCGLVEVPSSGVVQGEVANTDKAYIALAEALRLLAEQIQVPIGKLSLLYNGRALDCHNSWGITATTPLRSDPHDSSMRCVSEEDILRALHSATELRLSADLERLHEIPRCYKLDGKVMRGDVAGNNGIRLEVEVHIITCLREAIDNLIAVSSRGGYEPQEIVHSSIAASYISLAAEELEKGSLLIDLGYGSTSYQYCFEGQPLVTESLGLGGYHISRDVAEIFCVPFAIAEQLKLEHGVCWPALVFEDERVIIPGGASSMAQEIGLPELCEVLNARIEEMFEIIASRLQHWGIAKEYIHSVVLVGGSALLYGMGELAEEVFESPARTGLPEYPGLQVDANLAQVPNWQSPQYTALFGLALYWLDEERSQLPSTPFSGNTQNKGLRALLQWLRRKFF